MDVKIFSINRKIGMIGVVGTPIMPASGVQSHGRRVGNLYSVSPENCDFNGYHYEKEDGYIEVQAIDGMLMVTKDDVPWREDLTEIFKNYKAIVVRLGGDEFVAYVPEITDKEMMEGIAEIIISRLPNKMAQANLPTIVGTSVGICINFGQEMNFEEFFNKDKFEP